MYHRIVAAKIRKTFADMSAGKPQSLAGAMAPEFTYRFYGEHALSGERHTLDALQRWADRGARLIPDPDFQVDEVIVTGPPWNTRVATRVSVRAELPGVGPYENVFMQFMRLRWARIAEVRTLEDTSVLMRALDAIAAAGNPEAHAAPITD